MVAVEDLDVDARRRHPATELAKLTRLLLVEPLDEHVSLFDHLDACRLERRASGGGVLDQEMGDAAAVDDERTAALDAHARSPQGVSHLGQCPGPVLEGDRQVFHDGRELSAYWPRWQHEDYEQLATPRGSIIDSLGLPAGVEDVELEIPPLRIPDLEPTGANILNPWT